MLLVNLATTPAIPIGNDSPTDLLYAPNLTTGAGVAVVSRIQSSALAIPAGGDYVQFFVPDAPNGFVRICNSVSVTFSYGNIQGSWLNGVYGAIDGGVAARVGPPLTKSKVAGGMIDGRRYTLSGGFTGTNVDFDISAWPSTLTFLNLGGSRDTAIISGNAGSAFPA